VNIARPPQYFFAFHDRIAPALDTLFGELAREDYLSGADSDRFCNHAAHYMGELNAIHPFRDGNGRTQREFIRQLGLRNGYRFDWSRVSRDEMYAASHRSFQWGDNTGLAALLQSALLTLGLG
jgi:cell filamentation protein